MAAKENTRVYLQLVGVLFRGHSQVKGAVCQEKKQKKKVHV